MLGEVLARHPQVLGSVDGQPDALVPERAQAPLGGQLGKGAGLVVAALGEALERLLAEPRCLPEAGHMIVVVELDYPEWRLQRHDRDRRRGIALPVVLEQPREV